MAGIQLLLIHDFLLLTIRACLGIGVCLIIVLLIDALVGQ